MIKYQDIPLVNSILNRLKEGLKKELYYHSYDHTVDVIQETITYGTYDNLSDRELHLLVIAAAYHDAGFLSQQSENEELGASLAQEAMERSAEYSRDEIELVRTMILDTKMLVSDIGFCQVPTTELSKYLLDADVSNLGRDDFFDKGALVLKELGLNSEKKFLEHSLNLLYAHVWHTAAAQNLRQVQKLKNIEKLKSIISSK